MPEKKPNDYTASAVKLTNPPEVKEKLELLHITRRRREELEEQLKQANKDITDQIATLMKTEVTLVDEVKKAVETFGSYQDIAAGDYAIKQRRVTVSYDPEKVRMSFPAFAGTLIVESVSKPTMLALIEAGRIDPAIADSIAIKKEEFAFVIR